MYQSQNYQKLELSFCKIIVIVFAEALNQVSCMVTTLGYDV